MDLGAVLTGVLTGVATTTLLAVAAKTLLERGIANWFEAAKQARDLVGKAEIDYRQRQLSELYGPLYALMQASRVVYRLWMDGKLHHVNDDIKARFREQNETMLGIIRTKAHLIDGGNSRKTWSGSLPP